MKKLLMISCFSFLMVYTLGISFMLFYRPVKTEIESCRKSEMFYVVERLKSPALDFENALQGGYHKDALLELIKFQERLEDTNTFMLKRAVHEFGKTPDSEFFKEWLEVYDHYESVRCEEKLIKMIKEFKDGFY